VPSVQLAWRRARLARDPRFDGRFFVAVVTTGIYCRPICPAPSPHERNVRYFATAAGAAAAGFRPCLRCHPEVAPGTPAWQGTSATVSRGLRLIDEHGLDGLRVDALAARLGIGPRHLHRLFIEHIGASPHEVLQTRRLHLAKQLLDGTSLPFTAIASAAGFGSVRRFNEAIRKTWQRTPTAIRQRSSAAKPPVYALRLSYRPPYDWTAMQKFLAARAIEEVEATDDDRYARAFDLAGTTGMFEVRHDPAHRAFDVIVSSNDARVLYRVLARVTHVLDLDADPAAIARVLGSDPRLSESVRRQPGLRVPGGWDGFEIAVRAIVGQQASVAGARTILGRLARRFGRSIEAGGRCWRLFPTAAALANAPIDELGLTAQRGAALRAMAGAVADGRLNLGRDADPVEVRTALRAIAGVGPWTTEYIAMRALGDPDAFVAEDLIVARAAGERGRALLERAERWRPWRAYAVMHLWMGDGNGARVDTHLRREPRRTVAAGRTRVAPDAAALRLRSEAR
jgi:AraC family transcriptional regulator of adaptative response / DNA-3-methyladenine glycosylase II